MSIQEALTPMIQQSAPLVCLDRIVFDCCGWGSGDTIGSNDDDDIGGGKALGGEKKQSTNNRGEGDDGNGMI